MPERRGRWGPGEPGRPGGGESLTELIRQIGEEADLLGLSRREALATKLWHLAISGNLPAIKLLLEYLEGRPRQRAAAEVGGEVEFTADDAARAAAQVEEWEQIAKHPGENQESTG